MRKTLLFWGFYLGFVLGMWAQNALPIGQWRSHLPYRTGRFVAQSDTKVYYATFYSLLEIDKTDFAVRYYSTVDGLSNTDIALITYNRFSKVLIIVYENTVMDLLFEDGSVKTMSQIRNFSNFTGDKRVNDVHVENDSIIYLAANYGVSKINILSTEFVFTTFTNLEVNRVFVQDDYLYAGTQEGIYRIHKNNSNPDDFGNWAFLDSQAGFSDDYSVNDFAIFNDRFYIGINDTLFRYEGEQLIYVHDEPGSTLEYLSAEGEHLLAGYLPGRVVLFFPDEAKATIAGSCVATPKYAVEDASGRLWFGNEQVGSGFRYANTIIAPSCETLEFDSPWSEAVWDMTVSDGTLWLASGSLNQTLGPSFSSNGFYSFDGTRWNIYNRNTYDELKGRDPSTTLDDPLDFITIAVHPDNGKVYAGSFSEGIIEVDGDKITQFDDQNSTLQRGFDDPRVRIGGLVFDEDGQLWVANNTAPRPLSVLKEDGTWISHALSGCSQTEVFDIDIDENGFKWMALSSGAAGVLVFDEGAEDDLTDDRCRAFSSNNSVLPTNTVNCLTADLEGDIWVGTAEGIVIFECGGSAFEPECQGSRRVVEQDGFGAYLLETEDVKCIAVDGANRKWVGTKNGVFLLSANGEEQLDRFTTNNSPLFDNEIVEIAIDQNSGEVFIGTIKGLLSYQSDAVIGGAVHKSEVAVFPNPVRPEYEGPIAIKGLARDAIVKITDISGKLVFETTALGGQAIWDGRDYNGRKVQSGVYLVFSSSNSRFAGFTGKPDSAVAKILVIN
ncbi:MAG TPA: hypothetical protein PKA00_19680 [Saprospiraceae bacterium]|nr:hypothetical protein [Saprospiraceae bacterium]HMQ85140.1 hypothetical protein [Saprospiraceae bacterium]